ncbi:MFS transporter [Orrella marina]|nr:MFS transporter [Orrella marina]
MMDTQISKHNFATRLLLNIGHALDHMMLLIFATAVVSITSEFGLQSWEDLMPYSVGAFFFFGLGSIPSGRLGDLWGRRPMMILFFFSLGVASILVGFSNSPWQLAFALALLGCAASIYHPVGIPMLVEGETRPGWAIGVNGLAGNLGLAAAAVVTGFFVKFFDWRAAFIVPGIISIACGIAFTLLSPKNQLSPAKKKSTASGSRHGLSMTKLLIIMTIAATSASMVFNFSVNSNYELLSSRINNIFQDPAVLGAMLALVYVIASFTQLLVGKLLDRFPLKRLYQSIVALQFVALIAAATSDGWVFYILQVAFMAAIFGAIPFTDAMIVRFVDDSMRSRVTGMRLAVAFGGSSLAVWLIGPIVKTAGFTSLLTLMAATTIMTLIVVSQLPNTSHARSL